MNYKKRDLVEIAFLFYSFEQTTVCKVSDISNRRVSPTLVYDSTKRMSFSIHSFKG